MTESTDEDVSFATATDLAGRVRRREVGALELAEHQIARIERLDGDLNAVVVRDFDRALADARKADQTTISTPPDELGPLHGVPVTVKESYDLEGHPTTWGISEFADNVAKSDAEATRRYRRGGGVILGKTNVPLALGDFQSYNRIHGTTNNPWDHTTSPGGSSGGAAAALAAGLSALECGSDIGGSIRNPAHYCGVYGHKPTWGVVPPQGHALPGVMAGPDIAVSGPLARSADDLRLAMDLLAGPEPLDAPGWALRLPEPTKTSLSDYRVAIWADDERAPVSAEISSRAEEVGRLLGDLGATVSTEARPAIDIDVAHRNYMTMLWAILGADLPTAQYRARRLAAGDLDPADHSDAAIAVRAAALSHRAWISTVNRRETLRHAWRAFYDEWDILICPQSATTAMGHDHRPMDERTVEVDGAEQPYFQQIFWAGHAIGGSFPSTVFPTGLSAASMPIGLQAMGAEYHDLTTIEFTRLLAAELGGFTPPPGYS